LPGGRSETGNRGKTRRSLRQQSRGEELANSVSHGVGLLAAAGAVPALFMAAPLPNSTRTVLGNSLFAATLLLLYLVSALYHALPFGRAQQGGEAG